MGQDDTFGRRIFSQSSIEMLIERPPRWFRALFPGAVFRIQQEDRHDQCGDNEGRKSVYLTFDDGPIPEATPWILEELDRFGVKATFFMVGENARRYPRLLKEVVERGHQIGNHTLHHIRGLGISADKYVKDMEGCEELRESKLFRPPHGWLSPSQLKAVKKTHKVVMYDLITRDYSKRVSAGEVVKNVKRYTRNGSIIVFHDSLKSIEKLKTALPESLEWLMQEGYEFKLL